MNIIKLIWQNIGTRIWLLVTVITLILVFTVTMLATQLGFFRGTFNLVFGGDRPIIDETTETYVLDEGLTSNKDVVEAANKLNEEIAKEGTILLKNNGALPLAASEKKVTVFGKNSVSLVYGGSGSGNAAKANSKTIYDSLTAAQIEFNPTMKSFYDSTASGEGRPSNELMGRTVFGLGIGENPNGYDSVRSSYSGYKDAAIVVISRVGGEGFDLPRTQKKSAESNEAVDGARSATDHYLQLDTNETAMIKEATANFDKVIIVLNTAQAMEVAFADELKNYNTLKGYDIDAGKIDACVWVGLPGTTGIMSLGKVLTGEVNPSGRTTDTWAVDFRNDPSYKNFGSNNVLNGNRYLIGDAVQDAYYIDYEEGIYVGYKYYETRCAAYDGAITALGEATYDNGEEWYKANVLYPFGYGLSYTDFEWTIKSVSAASGSVITADSEIEITVTVENKGTRAGKDVVQLYYTPPYNPEDKPTAIEKSAVVLGDFAKTKEIPGGGKDDVTLKLKVSDMKSYDYNDANGNKFKGYELEAGDYGIKISQNAHEQGFEYIYKLNAGEQFEADSATGEKVENRFDDVSSGIDTYLSRADWKATFPTTPTKEDRQVDAAFIESLIWKKDDSGKPWEVKGGVPENGKSGSLKFSDMAGVKYEDGRWMELVKQLTVQEMADFIGSGAYQTARIDKIGKPQTIELDGPSGWSDFMGGAGLDETCFYAAECVMGATWNRDLALRMGQMIGNEALVALKDVPVSGWYAPGVNIHRSPFAGRNWEYYSEDGFLSGELAAQTCLGAKEKGVVTYVKHFVLNDNETDRDNTGTSTGDKKGLGGILVWANEQSMRELYFPPFEATVKQGKANGMMSSFNRIGKEWVGGSYRLLTEVLRNEWGFEGAVITDYGVKNYVNEDQMIRAGGDLRLNQSDPPTVSTKDATQVASMQKAVKNLLFTVVQSNILNVKISGYMLPIWVIIAICANVALLIGFGVWGFFAVRGALKKKKQQDMQ